MMPASRVPENDGKLSEILVKGHNNSVLLRGESENLIICGSCWPVSNPDHIMTIGCEFGRHAGPNTGVEQKPHAASIAGSNSLSPHQPTRENEAGLNISRLKVRICCQNVLGAITGREHAQYVFDGDALPSNNGFPAEDLRVNSDAGQ